MKEARQHPFDLIDWLGGGPLAAHADAFKHYLTERGYAKNSLAHYVSSVAHFAQWIHRRDIDVQRIDESIVAEFLDEHLPSCRCRGAVQRHRASLSAALGHLLVVLRARGVIAAPVVSKTPVNEELGRYGEYMSRVRGLACATQTLALSIARRFLISRFGDYEIDMTAIHPEQVRHFFAQEAKRYSKPVNTSTVVAALRGYFRYRASLGDAMHGLIGALSYPANWQLASLPKTLTLEEVEKLVKSLGQGNGSERRSAAIVRCALDLGLRSGEVARLGLDDIDWQAGTITLRHTKGRREDVLPLPVTTGAAIAAYLKDGRPKTRNRAVFVRHVAPRDRPVGPDMVRKTIKQAYARAGLPYTRSHLLRHTIANRLLAGGSSLKEVADVLRHRSLNTTLIYAKLDSRTLVEVALPWPGSTS
jgi:integrase/recombinase XerC